MVCNAVGKAWIIIVTKLCYILSHGKICGEHIYLSLQWCQPYTIRMWTQSHEPNSIHTITSMFRQTIFRMFWCNRPLYSEAGLTHGEGVLWLWFLCWILRHFLIFLCHLFCNAINLFLSCILSYHLIDPETFPPLQLTLTLGTTTVLLPCLQQRGSRSPALI